ncbi:MAG: hypothetical protein LBT16_10730 [Treponema sp.]|jgi:hypothetical protein|nr:hypothetical protein [Treponema sp.]
MVKTFSKIAIVFLVAFAVFMFAGCPTDAEPTGGLVPAPGAPGGIGGGGNALSFKPIAELNAGPELVAWPNPFIKQDGSLVASKEEWPARREEIKKMLEYYFCGTYPPQPSKVEVSGPGVTGAGNVTITVTGNGRTASFTLSNLTIPTTAPNGEPPSATNKIPLLLGGGAPFVPNGYATADFGMNSDSLAGIAQDIWQYDNSNDGRPSALVRDAWKVARVIDAAEIGIGGGVIDPDKFLVTGISRGGKDALYLGAFAESMSGKHVAVTNPVSSGSGGAAPDRFNAQSYHKNQNNKNTYFYKILDTVDGTPLVKLVTEDDPDAIDAGRTNFGYQTSTHARNETANWFGKRFQQFTEMYTEWETDWQSDTNHYQHGYPGTTPFDHHFLTALCAPYGLLTHDGWDSTWTNPEGMYVTYLATREVYEYIDKPDNIGVRIYKIGHANPTRELYDLIDFANAYFNRTFDTTYARLEGTETFPVTTLPAFQDKDLLYGSDTRMPDGKATLADWFDPKAQDPERRYEYLKLNWTAPNKPADSSVADIVRAEMAKNPEKYPGYADQTY